MHLRIGPGIAFNAAWMMSLQAMGSQACLLLLAGALGCTGGNANSANETPTPTPTGSATPTPTGTATPTPTPSPSECIPDPAPGDHTYPCDGLAYQVRVPAACGAPGCGLVLDVHGLSMDAGMEDANTKMRDLGEANGYVVIQPSATPAPPLSSWNVIEDYDKVYAFLQLAMSTWSIDADRVHIMGFSQGGQMTLAFLCAHADVFASIAPGAAAGAGCSFTGTQIPSREVPILQMHGTADALVSFTATGVPQRDAIRAAWSMDGGTVIASGAGFTRTRYTSAAGTVLEFIQHDYEASSFIIRGHCYPGSEDLNGGAPGQLFGFGCQGANGFDFGEEAIAFFIAHPRE